MIVEDIVRGDAGSVNPEPIHHMRAPFLMHKNFLRHLLCVLGSVTRRSIGEMQAG